MIARIPEKAATRKAAPKKLSAGRPRNRKPRLPKRAQLALAEFQERTLKLFPEDILAIILYGSYARGDASSESDVDVMVVGNWVNPGDAKAFYQLEHADPRHVQLSNAALEISSEFGLTISLFVFSEKEFNTDAPLAGEAKREGIVLWRKERWKMAEKEEEHPAKPRDPQTWLALAQMKLEDSRKIFKAEVYGNAISSAYYAMFYASRAALLSQGLYLVKHQAAIDKFGELFIKPGMVDKKFSDYLKGAKEKREQSDYEPYDPVSREDAEKVLADAEAFIAKVHEILSASEP